MLSAIPSPSLKTLVKFNCPTGTKRRLMSGKRRRMSEQTRATPCPALPAIAAPVVSLANVVATVISSPSSLRATAGHSTKPWERPSAGLREVNQPTPRRLMSERNIVF